MSTGARERVNDRLRTRTAKGQPPKNKHPTSQFRMSSGVCESACKKKCSPVFTPCTEHAQSYLHCNPSKCSHDFSSFYTLQLYTKRALLRLYLHAKQVLPCIYTKHLHVCTCTISVVNKHLHPTQAADRQIPPSLVAEQFITRWPPRAK